MKKIYAFLILLLVSGLGFGQTTVTYDFAASGASTADNLDTNISFTTAQNGGTLAPFISSGQLRLDEDPVKGGSIIITPLNGVAITDVIINASGRTFDAAYTIDNGSEVAISFLAGSYTISGIAASTEVEFYQKQNGANKEIYVDTFEVIYTVTPVTYSFNGTWSPIDPNGTATVNDDLIITSGNAAINTNTICNTVTVNPGASLTISPATTLQVDGASGLTLESTSDQYSSLIVDGSIVGTINYERHVNIIGTAGAAGNDLISVPLMPSSGLTFDTFLGLGTPTNASKLATNGTFYAFAPYNNAALAYENFTVGATDALIKGKGYRAATTASDVFLTFSGAVDPNNVSIPLSIGAGGSQWNLVGNPYPSYLSSSEFLSANAADLDVAAVAIYGYNSNTYTGSGDTVGNFTIINNATNTNLNIAPGQGFLVAANRVTKFPGNVVFNNGSAGTMDMRTLTGTDDFIEGRTPTAYNLKLNFIATNTTRTSFYFNDNSSLGLDPGYDAAVYGTSGNSYPIYSHLVENNKGRAMALQSLNTSDLSNVTIPLGVNANQGEQLRFTIADANLPSTVSVYLEDAVKNTSTLLTDSDYVLTPSVDLNGTGRFFLRFADSALSIGNNSLDALRIYTNNGDKTIVIAGQLLEATKANIYDLQGRLVTAVLLETSKTSQSIDVSNLSTGVYVIQLTDASKSKSQKLIIR